MLRKMTRVNNAKVLVGTLTKVIPVSASALPVIVTGSIIGHKVGVRSSFKCFLGLHVLRKSLRVQVR